MKIKKIEINNNPILGDITFDFTDKDQKVVSNIIIAGENGVGKTTLLDLIFNFCNIGFIKDSGYQKFTVLFTDDEINSLKNQGPFSHLLNSGVDKNEIDFWINHGNEESGISFYNDNFDRVQFPNYHHHPHNYDPIRRVFRSIYSSTEINFTPNEITSVTARNIDEQSNHSVKSSPNLATEITQLLIDIKALDDTDLSDWVNTNEGVVPPEDMKKIRMKRFENAFNFMFPTKRYSGIQNQMGHKKVFFKEHQNEMPIEKLSSGEKQIVFRGSFLLKDKKSSEGIVALIDEPEISLHPDWQKKIMNYFKMLFTNEKGIQTSQVFYVTHSPFIIHNTNRSDDKVIILKKDGQGNVFIPEQGKYFSWTEEQIVEEAFNLSKMIERVDSSKKHLIVTEGKTDWKHLKKSLEKLRESGLYTEDRFEFLEFEETNMGDRQLLSFCEQISKIENDKKVICIFDRDVKDVIKKVTSENEEVKYWGNNVYSFIIPTPEHRRETPEISIEHYYKDEEIKTIDNDGKRLYLGYEFSSKSGKHIIEGNKFCKMKNKVGQGSITIIDRDSDVFLAENEDENIALSKNQFVENIFNDKEPFNRLSYQAFKLIFDVIDDILSR